MPKVFLTDSQKENDRLRHNLLILQGKRTNNEMGKIIGKTGVTYASRLRTPEDLTQREVRLLCDYFKIDRKQFVTERLVVS